MVNLDIASYSSESPGLEDIYLSNEVEITDEGEPLWKNRYLSVLPYGVLVRYHDVSELRITRLRLEVRTVEDDTHEN